MSRPSCSKCVPRECSHHMCSADKTLVFRSCDNVADSKIRGLLQSILFSEDEGPSRPSCFMHQHHTHEPEPEPVCTADKTLVFRACDNAAGRTVTDSEIRGLLNSILPSEDEEGAAPSALAEFVFDFDPKRRCGLSEEQLAKLDDHVPMSLVMAMQAFGILDDANLDCWVCGHDASIMPVRCAAPGCKAAAHADCLHVTCPDKATLERLTASAKLACGAHKHLKPRWDKLVSTDPDDPPCALCGEGIAKPDLIRCAHEGCQAYHVNCLPGVSLRAKVYSDFRAFKFNCLSDAHCRPKFVGQP